jgi:hypothetical protein
MFNNALAIAAALALAACVTTAKPGSSAYSYCERMERQMGTDHTHDHAAAKGMGINPMNVTHDRCRQMLGIN